MGSGCASGSTLSCTFRSSFPSRPLTNKRVRSFRGEDPFVSWGLDLWGSYCVQRGTFKVGGISKVTVFVIRQRHLFNLLRL